MKQGVLRIGACVILIGVGALTEAGSDGQESDSTAPGHWSPQELWRDVNVKSLPLEAETLRSWEEDSCTYSKLTYVSEIVDGTKIRIFAIKGIPKSGKQIPGILHIHGGGQTASLAWVQYWAKRGYACVSYDFCGPWEKRTEYTDWGPLAKNCNMASNGVYQVHPTPRNSGWFHWALAGRRALTLLTQESSVDPERLGIFGISVGGTLCWLVAGADHRIKAAIPIYGCGYNVDRRKAVHGIVPSEDQLLYQEALTPEAHAPYIKCPLLFVSASNDHHGWIDDAFDSLKVVPADTWQAFTPRYIHHVDAEQGRDLSLWMNWHLKNGKPFPKTPRLDLTLGSDGVILAAVHAPDADRVKQVTIYYALGMKIPPSRYWRRRDPVSDRHGRWTASLPMASIWDRICVFANVNYSSGLSLSTEQAIRIPGQMGKAKATLTPSLQIDDGFHNEETWFYGPAYTDPNIDRALMTAGDDDGRRFVSVNQADFGETINFTVASHIFGDPQFVGPRGASLSFDCKGGFDTNGLTVTFAQGEWMLGAINFKARLDQNEIGGGWKTVHLPLSRFTNEAGASPVNWSKVDRLLLSGTTPKSEPPLFARFRWVLE